ncbi:unnamed protein product [Somion occarium]|uniref:N-acetyltransferase domain-containing protein n=1 Tax=Somion occarium TaxID=3059160 RepID=A0ABP1CN01_9APHY
MSESAARIRPFQPSDQKLVRFYVGKSRMEGLTSANVRALSSAFVHYMQWWPRREKGLLENLSPLSAFACMALPIMFITDWVNRPDFEKSMNDALRRPDLVDTAIYYARSPASGFWILEFNDRFVGLIAVDASLDSTSDEVVVGSDKPAEENAKPAKSYSTKGTSNVATIRHFYVEEPYRTASVQDDLLEHAIKHAFAEKEVERIRAVNESLVPYIGEALHRQGFVSASVLETVGVLNWHVHESVLERKVWESKQKA